MKIILQNFKDLYYQSDNDKFVDRWREKLKLLPFDTGHKLFDKKCGYLGVTGEFFRLCYKEEIQPIESYEEFTKRLELHLDKKQMDKTRIAECVEIFRDILYINGDLNFTDVSFLKYLPFFSSGFQFKTKNAKSRYKQGQEEIAEYLYSMLDGVEVNPTSNSRNILSEILRDALSLTTDGPPKRKASNAHFYILPHIRKQFGQDIQWMQKQEEMFKVKYFPLFLHFYACYATTQTVAFATTQHLEHISESHPFYFIFNSEKTHANHDAVLRGWERVITKPHLKYLFGKVQALDILNSILGREIGFYNEVLAQLSETPFEENRADCSELLEKLAQEKKAAISRRQGESQRRNIALDFDDYESFVKKLEEICTGYQSYEYAKIGTRFMDLMKCRFLKRGGRSNYVLNLDKEMLMFLLALMTKGERTKLETVYSRFKEYGILFNSTTRNAIENEMLKANFLDSKSDSGEAQYINVVL